jgi:hypothetical protein
MAFTLYAEYRGDQGSRTGIGNWMRIMATGFSKSHMKVSEFLVLGSCENQLGNITWNPLDCRDKS